MRICGLQKTTLLDYPGKVACTVFLGGCNFRCPFCQNSEILSAASPAAYTEEELFAFLQKRRGILEGVCVSGGEPLLHEEAEALLKKIKVLGYCVKVDTNGSFPARLKKLCAAGLVDFVAMDIKNSPAKYAQTCGAAVELAAVRESAAFLLAGGVDYEFRTTVADELHTEEDMEEIGAWLAGAKRFYLQNFRDAETVLCPGLHPCSEKKLQAFRAVLRRTIPEAKIRGE